MYWHNPCEINGNSPGVVAKTWPGEAWNGMETPFFMEVLRDDWAIPEVSLVAFSQRQCTWQIYANIKDAGRPACSMVRATSIQIVWKGVRQQSRLLDAVQEWKKHSPPEGTVVWPWGDPKRALVSLVTQGPNLEMKRSQLILIYPDNLTNTSPIGPRRYVTLWPWRPQ